MALIGPDHRYIQTNVGYEKFFGETSTHYSGRHLREVLGDAEYESNSKPNLERCFAGEPTTFESRYDYPRVGLRSVRIDYTPLKLDVNQSVSHVLATVVDITDIRQIQDELSQESYRLNAVIKGTRTGTWQWNAETGEMRINDRWAEMLGYTVEELFPITGATWIDLLHPDDEEVTARETAKHISGKTEFYDCEFRMRHKEGHWVWIHTRGQVGEWRDAKPVWVFGTHIDITARKHEEERKREVQNALKHRENQLSDILKAVPGALVRYIVNPDGKDQIVYFSEKAKEVWEISENDFSDVEVLWDMVHEEFIDGLVSSFRESAERNRYWEQTWKITTPQKRVKWLNGRGHPRKQEDGSYMWNLLVLDVSPLKEAEERLRESEAQARAADAAKTDFLNMMNHELRTPLNAIIGPLDLLDQEDNSEDQQCFIDLMKPASAHLLSLINDILSLSKIQAEKYGLTLEMIDLSSFLKDALGAFHLQAKDKQIGFSVEISDELPDWIETDARAVRQILLNLISNAIKFTDQGQVSVDVSVKYTECAGAEAICIAVTDTGIGIGQEDLASVFLPFEQVDTGLDRAYQGTGLGLSIALELAELLGGGLTLTSELGVGSKFILTLPLVSAEPSHEGSNETSNEVPKPEVGGQELQILVVEDNLANLQFFRMVLDRLGLRADFADDGQSALNLFELNHYQLVFCDIRLPDMSGEEVASKLRGMRGGMDAMIIANTAYVTDEYKKEILSKGFDGFLPKPMTVTDVQAILEEFGVCSS